MASKPSKTEDDFRAEDDHRTLQRAEEVRADPKRLAGVERHHVKQMAAMQRVGKLVMGKAPFGTKAPVGKPSGQRSGSRGPRRSSAR